MTGFNHWSEIAAALDPACERAVVNTAQKAQNNIQDVIRANGQVRTGKMHDWIYNISAEGSTYPSTSDPLLLPEVQKPKSRTEAVVAAGASYSVFQDKGTVYISPRPFFNPGLDRTR